MLALWRYNRLITLFFCFVGMMYLTTQMIAPRPMMELPENGPGEFTISWGFSDDGEEFFTTNIPLNSVPRKNVTAWNLKTKTGRKTMDFKTTPKYHWNWYTPLAMDDLCVVYDLAWEIRRRDSNDTLAYFHDLERPFLARQSPDQRFIAVELYSNVIEVIDTSKSTNSWRIPDECIVQFSQQSELLFTMSAITGNNVLSAWDLKQRKKLWSKSGTLAKSVKDGLQDEFRYSPFSIGRAQVYAHRFPCDISCGSGQVFFWKSDLEWKGALAEWLMVSPFRDLFNSYRLVAVDSITGEEIRTGPLRSKSHHNTKLSPDGKHLAIQVSKSDSECHRWVIYALPFQTQWYPAILWSSLVTVLLSMVFYRRRKVIHKV